MTEPVVHTIELPGDSGQNRQILITVEDGGVATINVGQSIHCSYACPEWLERAFADWIVNGKRKEVDKGK